MGRQFKNNRYEVGLYGSESGLIQVLAAQLWESFLISADLSCHICWMEKKKLKIILLSYLNEVAHAQIAESSLDIYSRYLI